MFLANWCMIVVPSLQAMVLASGHRGATRVGAALVARARRKRQTAPFPEALRQPAPGVKPSKACVTLIEPTSHERCHRGARLRVLGERCA